MRKLIEPREETDLAIVVKTSRGKDVKVLALDPATLATPATKLRSFYRADLAGMQGRDMAEVTEEIKREVLEGAENGVDWLEFARILRYCQFGLIHFDDGIEFETPIPRRQSRMTGAEWVEYGSAIEDELTSGLGRLAYTYQDVQDVVDCVQRQDDAAVEAEKKASTTNESGETSTPS